jgi:hypothetical protein
LALALFILLVILPLSVNLPTALWPTKGSKKSYGYFIPRVVKIRMDSMMSSSAAASILAPSRDATVF